MDKGITAAATRSRMTDGAKILADAGVSTSALAWTAGVSAAQISHWLRGFRPAPPEFFAAVQAVAGPTIAAELRRLLQAPTALVATEAQPNP